MRTTWLLALALTAAVPVAAHPLDALASPAAAADDKADALYRTGRDAIDAGHFEQAIASFTKLAETTPARADGALYWTAYAQNKLGQRADALRTLADLQRRFGTSRWAHDGRALELEIRQASGQKVSPDAQQDDDLKLLALSGLMAGNADRALPVLQEMLAAPNSPKVKDRALFVLSQSRTPEARAMIAKIAKDGSNADVQMRALKYVGLMGGPDGREILEDAYRSTTDLAVKRAVLRSLMLAGDRARVLAAAKSEASAELRGEAVQQLGVMGADQELAALYGAEKAVEIRKKILQALFVGGATDRLIDLAKTEKLDELRRTAVRDLGLMGANRTGDALVSIYNADAAPDIKRAAIEALFLQNNAHALVTIARAEKSPDLKKDIVSKLALMKSKEASDYLMEILK